MNFGHVLNHLKLGGSRGSRARRAGWNSKGMFIWLVHGNIPKNSLDIPRDQRPFHLDIRTSVEGDPLFREHPNHSIIRINGVSHVLFDADRDGMFCSMPYFTLRAADGSNVSGWVPSQVDMLAEDWELIHE